MSPQPGNLRRSAFPLLLAASLSLSPCPPARAAAGLPGDLEGVRAHTVDRLEALYAVPHGEVRKPISIRLQGPDAPPPPQEWLGLPAYAAGAANPSRGRIILFPGRTGRYPFGDLAQTLRHELSHVLLYRSLGYPPPRWLDEGLAMRAAGEWKGRDRFYVALALFGVAKGRFSLDRLEEEFRSGETEVRRAYALANAFVRDLFRTDDEVTSFLLEARRSGSVERAFHLRFGVHPAEAFQRWARDLPWWGEWLVWIGSPATLWYVVLVIFLASAWASRRRRKRVYEQLPD